MVSRNLIKTDITRLPNSMRKISEQTPSKQNAIGRYSEGYN